MIDPEIDIHKFNKAIFYTISISSPLAYIGLNLYDNYILHGHSPIWVLVGWSLVAGLGLSNLVIDYLKAHDKLKPDTKK